MELRNGNAATPDVVDEKLRVSVKGLTEESISLHDKVNTTLETFYTCAHGIVSITDWPCEKFVDRVSAD